VPVVPYTTDSVELTIGQRYDVIVEANAAPGDYWLRGGWNTRCASIENAAGITGIVRYDTGSTAEPNSVSTVTPSTHCLGEPVEKTVPHLSLDVTNMRGGVVNEVLGTVIDEYFKWTINTSSLMLDWSDPTMGQIFEGKNLFPTEYNVVPVDVSITYWLRPPPHCVDFERNGSDCNRAKATGDGPEWVVLVIQDTSNIG
jgi:hypothetical protein